MEEKVVSETTYNIKPLYTERSIGFFLKFAKKHSEYRLVDFCVEQANHPYYEPRLHFLIILRLSAYFNLGKDIGSREDSGTRLKARNEKHEKHLQILRNSVYLRSGKFTGCQYRY